MDPELTVLLGWNRVMGPPQEVGHAPCDGVGVKELLEAVVEAEAQGFKSGPHEKLAHPAPMAGARDDRDHLHAVLAVDLD